MPMFHDARALREITKRPMLGMVSLLPSDRLIRKRVGAAPICSPAAWVDLFAAFAAVFAFALLIGRAA